MPDGILYHVTNASKIWIDSMYMAPPFLAVAGYLQEAVKQIEGMKRYLWDSEKKLYSHIWNDEKKIFERKDHWGVGNGWAAAGLVRVIKALPESMTVQRTDLIDALQQVIDGCLVYQRDDGVFHNVVDKPETFVEVNLAQMLAYSIYRSVKAGRLATRYTANADRMRAPALAQVSSYCSVPNSFGPPNLLRPPPVNEGQTFLFIIA